MNLKFLTPVLFAAALLPQLAGAQINYIQNTNQPIAGTNPLGWDSNPITNPQYYGAGGAITVQFKTGSNAFGYALQSISLLMGNATGDPSFFNFYLVNTNGNNLLLFGYSNSGGNPSPLVNPQYAGVYTYAVADAPYFESLPAGYMVNLAPNAEYSFVVESEGTYKGNDYEWDYSLSAPTVLDGWSIVSISGFSSGPFTVVGTPMFAISASPITSATPTPIHLINAAALPDGSFQFGFTNSPGFNFTAYGTTNVTLPFTNWFNLGNPVNVGSNYYQYNTGPGVVPDPDYPHFFFRVTSP